ncbi:hypothetical protein EK904_006772 [Melospiza melodia maxima]|nr:hypothetical protein EK904_006772 [Melospiza melodia maxima]
MACASASHSQLHPTGHQLFPECQPRRAGHTTEEQPEAGLAPAAQAECKALSCSSVKRMDGLLASAHSPNSLGRAARQAPGAAALHSSQEKLHLFLCPSKCITCRAQVIFLQPYHKTSKHQSCCVFAYHSPRNDLLPEFYGQREPVGAPQRERQAWVSHAGAGAKAAAAAAVGGWKKRRFTKGDCAFPRWAAAGGSLASGKARQR